MGALSGLPKSGTFAGEIGGVATGSNGVNISIVVPAGQIFEGMVSFYGTVATTGFPPCCVLNGGGGGGYMYFGNQSNPSAAGNCAAAFPVKLNAGTWTLTAFTGFTGSSNNIAYQGNCFYK